jgi:hypothetical protein
VAEQKKGDLEGRIDRLEKMFMAGPKREAVDLSADEVNAYLKVRDVIAADYGEFCGINDCFRCMLCRSCSVCRVCRICRMCDVECICGPCNIGGMGGGAGDFTRFGG